MSSDENPEIESEIPCCPLCQARIDNDMFFGLPKGNHVCCAIISWHSPFRALKTMIAGKTIPSLVYIACYNGPSSPLLLPSESSGTCFCS
jgi:hypothetical protein